MSLITAVYVPTGIVFSGDSRTTWTLSQQVPQPTAQDPNATVTVQTPIVLSDSAHKVFLVFQRFGVGTFGAAIVNDMPIAHYVEAFQTTRARQEPALAQECAEALLSYFRALSPIPETSFLVGGYDGTEPSVLEVNVIKNSTKRWNVVAGTNQVMYGILRGGDTAIVNRLLSQQQFNPSFNVMNLQDAVDYSRHLIRTTIDQMKYEPRFPTVGGPIDTLVLTPGNARFLARKELTC